MIPMADADLRLSDFDFELPDELIAQAPLPERPAGRLLHVDGDRLFDRRVRDLPALVVPGEVFVFNDTRVINARLFGTKATGGRIELLVERVTGPHEFLAMIRASHSPKPGSRITIEQAFDARVLAREDRLHRLAVDAPETVLELLARHGSVPLPPYIGRAPTVADAARYQTVFADAPGAVAAPTAGLHFDHELLDALARQGVSIAFVTLHVGAGTFAPVKEDDLSRHRMHSEWYSIPEVTASRIARAKADGRPVTAVGTTALRALESAALGTGSVGSGSGETGLFITPGFHFRVVDRLLTNFHLPRSTLLMLVSAFAGMSAMRSAYAHAIAGRYRFFSYGDATLLERGHGPA